MKKRLLFVGIFSTFFVNQLNAYSNFHPIDGIYYGMDVGAQYLGNFNDVPLPAITGILATPQTGTYRSSIGFGGDLHIGYRLFELFRAEGELFYGYQKLNSIQANDGTAVSPRDPNTFTNGNKLQGNTQNYGAMINGYFDMFFDTPRKSSSFTPYVGGGIGYARMSNKDDIVEAFVDGSQQGALIAELHSTSQNLLVWQGIAGFGWFPDDFTFFGVDFRYQDFGKINSLNGKGITYGAYLVMNFAVG